MIYLIIVGYIVIAILVYLLLLVKPKIIEGLVAGDPVAIAIAWGVIVPIIIGYGIIVGIIFIFWYIFEKLNDLLKMWARQIRKEIEHK